ncbi:hypothetical protein LTR62_000847 [Meristemomyces frigidus]|uniref:Uncharacterized protein n=1 Tax=Meristemomyces frigidus TaxID=1508187 RepID=A0AAN7YQT7_9PEZI|nr:hypothetical protein LTR62_000847 [Meristemomyces frigidus]
MRYSVVIGDVNGRFADVFGKLTALHRKQNFAFAIIAGNLFADPEAATEKENEELAALLRGDVNVPLTTYFAIGRRPLPKSAIEVLENNQGELCANLSVLGRKVSIKTSEGFRLVAVGGARRELKDLSDAGDFIAAYSNNDIQDLSKGLTDADMLITSEWPSHIQDGAKVKYTGTSQTWAESISELCTATKPRYHFSTSSSFYEREAFFHDGPAPRSVTRFISLAPFGNAGKQKWIYAFALEPSAPPLEVLPPGCTASPFTGSRKRKLESQAADYNNFRYSNGNSNGHYPQDQYSGKRRRGPRQPPPTPRQCYFCLSNPACETHMVGSIGENVYLTTAKGPLTTKDSNPDLNFPGHMLLIPLEHAPTMGAIEDRPTRQATVIELQKYRTALQNMLAEKSRKEDGHAKLGAVCWEISRNTGIHLHWQFMPVPVDLIQRGLVEAAFDVEAENLNYPKFAKKLSEMEDLEEGNYFKVMIWSETLRKEMVLSLDGDFRFDLQYGRKVMAKLLELDGRMDWRACTQSKAEEEADAKAFKEAFKRFDFSLME